jgi:outer membrane protein TolC
MIPKRWAFTLITGSILLGTMIRPGIARAEDTHREEIGLSEALHELSVGNPSLTASSYHVKQAEIRVWEAGSALFPGLVFMGEYTRHEEPTLVTPMREPPTPLNPLDLDDEIYTGVLRLDIPILNLPAVAAVQGAQSDVVVRRAQSAELEQTIIGRVAEIFVQAGQIRDSSELLDSHSAALERRLDETIRLEQAGRASPAGRAVLEASLERMRAERLELELHIEELSLRLAEILGRREPVTPVAEGLTLPHSVTGALTATGVTGGDGPGALTAEGPRALTAEAQRSGAEAAKRATVLSLAPSITGFAARTSRSGADREFTDEWSAGITVTVPLVTGGERTARIYAADAGVKAAEAGYRTAQLQENTAVRIAQARWDSAERRREILSRAIGEQKRAVTAQENLYREGRISLSELLSEETSLLDLRMQEKRVLYEQLLAYVSYQQTVGRLTVSLLESLIQE